VNLCARLQVAVVHNEQYEQYRRGRSWRAAIKKKFATVYIISRMLSTIKTHIRRTITMPYFASL